MNKIKTAVGKYNFPAGSMNSAHNRFEFFNCFYFVFGICPHGRNLESTIENYVRTSFRMAARISSRCDGGRSALHDHNAASIIGKTRSMFGAGAACQRQSINGNNGISRPGDIRNLIRAIDRDMHWRLAAFEESHAKSALGNQQ